MRADARPALHEQNSILEEAALRPIFDPA